MLNRKKTKDLNYEMQKILSDQAGYLHQKFLTPAKVERLKGFSKPTLGVKLFQIIDLKWVGFYSDQDSRQLAFKVAVKNDKETSLIVHDAQNDKNVSLEIKVHPYLNFAVAKGGMRFSFQNEKGNIFGIELPTGSDFQLDELLGLLQFSPYS